jgi:pimeloyl-ACP methyl ester carboxylesterase
MQIDSLEIPVTPWTFQAIAAGPADGEPVLLLHGFPQTSHSYRRQLPALAGAGYRAVAFDQRGYSPQARPTDLADYAMPNLVDDALGVANALGFDRFHVVGHDFGAIVGWHLASNHPDRLASYTSLSVGHPAAIAAALADPTDDQTQRSSYFAWFEQPETTQELGSFERLMDLYAGAGLADDDPEAYARALGSHEAIDAALNWYRAGGVHRQPDAPHVTVPTMLIWSTADVALGATQAKNTERYVSAPYQFHVLEGVDHWIPEHAADRVNQLLVDHIGTWRLERQ